MSEHASGPPPPEKLLIELLAELRALAAHYLRGERADDRLQPTELVHEVYLRMRGRPGLDIKGRSHFMAVAATAMRRVLVDHARSRGARKRGGGVTHVTVSEANAITTERTQDVLRVDAALERLAAVDPVGERIVVMRFFAGMTEKEIATVMGRSERWVRNQWAFARAWLQRDLDQGDGVT